MKRQAKGQIGKQSRTVAALRTLLLILLALVLGVKFYTWNAMSLVGNRLPMPFGYGASVVLSGSMEPNLSVNDLVIIKETQDVNVGDVIVYESGGEMIIHRVLNVDGDTIITQGDANNIADEPFDVSSVRGKMIASFPAVGGLVRILKTPAGTIGLLVAAFLLIELSYHRESQEDEEIKEMKAEIRRLKEEKEKNLSQEPTDGTEQNRRGGARNGDVNEI
jgi:signal peptidase